MIDIIIFTIAVILVVSSLMFKLITSIIINNRTYGYNNTYVGNYYDDIEFDLIELIILKKLNEMKLNRDLEKELDSYKEE